MGNLWKKLIRKVFKSSSYRVNNFSKIFSFKVKTIDEIQTSNRNTIYKYFLDYFYFQSSKNIRLHRYYFKKNKRGFGEDAFHGMWDYLFSTYKPKNILEIGVYRGQSISLFELMSQNLNLKADVWGITPLSNDGDSVSSYESINYEEDIKNNYKHFNLGEPKIIKAFSTDDQALKFIKSKKWDLIYIDGSHDYVIVQKDILNSLPYLKSGGILVLDDSSLNTDFNLKIPYIPTFKGHPGPSKVFSELINEKAVKLLFGVGHNNVFVKKK